MARNVVLGPAAQKAINAAVDLLFDRAKARLLGVSGKQLAIHFNPLYSLSGLFQAAGRQEGVEPRDELLKMLHKIAGAYIDANREKAKAQVLQQIQAFMVDAQNQGIKTDVKTVLGSQLADLWGSVRSDVKRIVETETTVVRNTSIFDAIGRIGAMAGRKDPTVFFVTVRDNHRCEECTRLHVQPDGVTPRVWLMSELGSGYHKRGDPQPKVGGLHPHCRCVLTHLLPGYGFDAGGRVTYIEEGHDELAKQRGIQKHESDDFEVLAKGLKQNQIKAIMRGFGWVDKAGGGHDMMEHPAIGAKIPFQRGYAGDYDWPWVDKHLGSAGLIRNRQNKVVADPNHAFFEHYVKTGHATLPEPTGPAMKTWHPPGAETHLPIETVEAGGVFDGRSHAEAVRALKTGQPLPHVEVMDLGSGTYGTLSNHHVLQAARDAGMTHIPVKLVKHGD